MVAEEGAHAIALAGDVSSEEFAYDAVEKVLGAFGKIDILVNNAGTQRLVDSIRDISAKQLAATFAVNVFSACASRFTLALPCATTHETLTTARAVYLSKAVLPHMQRGGAIINTSSVAAYQGRPDMIDCASAQALFSRTQLALTSRIVCALRRHRQQGRTVRAPRCETPPSARPSSVDALLAPLRSVAFTYSLAQSPEVLEKNIRVNAVAPGDTCSPLVEATYPGEQRAGHRAMRYCALLTLSASAPQARRCAASARRRP